MLKLACANCGAPLEIAPDLDTFACGYCGSQQRVHRSGGVVALRKVETAIKAVQRGTDRTAAELALPRLRQEMAELEAQYKAALEAAQNRGESAKRGRRMLTFFTFVGILIAGPLLVSAAASNSPTLGTALSFGWFVGLFAVPIFVYRRIKLPTDQTAAVKASFTEKIQTLKKHIEVNRSILDELPR